MAFLRQIIGIVYLLCKTQRTLIQHMLDECDFADSAAELWEAYAYSHNGCMAHDNRNGNSLYVRMVI